MKKHLTLQKEEWFPLLCKALKLKPEDCGLVHVASFTKDFELTMVTYIDLEQLK